MGIFSFAAAIAAAAATPAPTPAPAPVITSQRPDADPAIWVVNDADTTIYLFGTFHALDGRSEWFNDEIRTCFVRSEQLVLETVMPKAAAPVALPPMLPRVSSLAPSASFLASTKLAISAGKARGMKVDQGADVILRSAAEAAGKPVAGLETVEFQLRMFQAMPGAAKPASGSAQDEATKAALSQVMAHMQAAWNRGDQRIFTAMLDRMRTTAPDNYRIMFTDRNTHWAQWIAERLQKPGTVFVAVGAGHLAGQDSVQAKLRDLGVASARIN